MVDLLGAFFIGLITPIVCFFNGCSGETEIQI